MPGSMQQHLSHNVLCHWMTGKEVGLGCVSVALLWCSAPRMPSSLKMHTYARTAHAYLNAHTDVCAIFLAPISGLADSTAFPLLDIGLCNVHCLLLGSSLSLERAANTPFACWVRDSPAHRFYCITTHSHAHCTAAGEGGVWQRLVMFLAAPPSITFPTKIRSCQRKTLPVHTPRYAYDGKENVGKMQVHDLPPERALTERIHKHAQDHPLCGGLTFQGVLLSHRYFPSPITFYFPAPHTVPQLLTVPQL